MTTADECRKHALEADALARLVSLGSDRGRLQAEARHWRERAEDLDAHERLWTAPKPPTALSGLAALFGHRR